MRGELDVAIAIVMGLFSAQLVRMRPIWAMIFLFLELLFG